MNRTSSEPRSLRRRAEAQIALGDLPSKLHLDPIRLSHELQVHKIELELQNEDLISANRELDALRTHYQTMFEQAPVAYLMLSPSGDILELNTRAAGLLGGERHALLNRPMHDLVAVDSAAEFERLRLAAAEPVDGVSADNLVLRHPRVRRLHVKAQARRIEPPDHDGALILLVLMDISPLEPVVDEAGGIARC